MRCEVMAIVLSTVALGGRAAAAPAPEAPPATFRQLSSPHLTLATDLSAPEARAALRAFEAAWALDEEFVLPSNQPRSGRVDVVLLCDEADYRALAPPPLRDHGGYYRERGVDRDASPLVVLRRWPSDTTDDLRRRFQHELTHRAVGHHFPGAPPWLNEGLAEFYSTMRVDGGQVIIGAPPRPGSSPALPTVEELLAADFVTFQAPARRAAFYRAAWALVHFLKHGSRDNGQRFVDFENFVAAGHPVEAAWKRYFGHLVLAQLDRDLGASVARPTLSAIRVPASVTAATTINGERALSEEEVFLLRVRLRSWQGDAARKLVEADLAAAHRAAPDSPSVHYWSALLLLAADREAEAEQELRVVLAARPDDPGALLELAELLLRRVVREPGEHDLRPLDPLVARLARRASSQAALAFLARFHQRAGDLQRSAAFFQRAVEKGCSDCAGSYAGVLFALGQREAAAEMLERWLSAAVEVKPIWRVRLAAWKQGRDAIAEERAACDGADSRACVPIAAAYFEGAPVPWDPALAASLLERACHAGVMDGCDDLAAEIAGPNIVADGAHRRELLSQACARGSMTSCNNLGDALEKGRLGPPDLPLAVAFYTRACDGGEIWGCMSLADVHRRGAGVPVDAARALLYLRRAGKLAPERLRRSLVNSCYGEDAGACGLLTVLYTAGVTTVPDEAHAAAFRDLACRMGDQSSCSGSSAH